MGGSAAAVILVLATWTIFYHYFCGFIKKKIFGLKSPEPKFNNEYSGNYEFLQTIILTNLVAFKGKLDL